MRLMHSSHKLSMKAIFLSISIWTSLFALSGCIEPQAQRYLNNFNSYVVTFDEYRVEPGDISFHTSRVTNANGLITFIFI